MSEYVFDFEKFKEPDLSTGLREPIVRCCDCEFAYFMKDDGSHWCERKSKRFIKLYPFECHPYSFCSWGKPREKSCQNTDENAAAFADAPTMETARGGTRTPLLQPGA